MGPAALKLASLATAVMVGPVVEAMVSVAVTVGLGERLGLANVMAQEWLPIVALAGAGVRLMVAGVNPAAGAIVSQAQSGPSKAVKAMPVAGVALAKATF
jgi:hypothetical protein